MDDDDDDDDADAGSADGEQTQNFVHPREFEITRRVLPPVTLGRGACAIATASSGGSVL